MSHITTDVRAVTVFNTEAVFQFASQYSLHVSFPRGNLSLFPAPPPGCSRKPNFIEWAERHSIFQAVYGIAAARQGLIVPAVVFLLKFVLPSVNYFAPFKMRDFFFYSMVGIVMNYSALPAS